jgi:hypothetical protein
MRFSPLPVAALTISLFASALPARAEIWSVYGINGNDTGGIIPWSPENERNAFAMAEEQCRWHNKFPVATSIHRVYGGYIAYRCVWEKPRYTVRRYDRRLDEAPEDMSVNTSTK